MNSMNPIKPLVKPKIALLHYTAPPIVGGVEAVIAAHARVFVANGYPVKIIAGRGAEPANSVASNVEIVIDALLDSKNPRINALNAALDKGEIPEDFELLENEIFQRLQELLADCGVCIIHNTLTLHKNLALTSALHRLANSLPLKFIAWVHDLAWTNPLYLPVLYEKPPWTLLKTTSKRITYVAISPQRQAEILQVFRPSLSAEEIPIVPNGVAIDELLGVSEASRLVIKTAGLDIARSNGEILLLLPARITRRKNIELAIAVVAELKKQNCKVRLVVTGPPGPHNPKNDEYVRELTALRTQFNVEDEVIFLMERWQSNNQPALVTDSMMASLYQYCDAMLMPSTQEGFGIPILEAAVARLPIFCSDLPPFRELAGDAATYFALDEQPANIAKMIVERMQADSAFRLRQHALNNFSWESIFRQKIEPLVDNLGKI